MSSPRSFEGTHYTDVNHSQFNTAGRDQYNTYNTIVTNQETVLGTLKPVDRSGYYVPPCMRGTRKWLVQSIHCWLNDQQATNILWLSGSPGSGKSTIASTLVSQLGEVGWLGSSFFFKRGDIALSDPAAVWRTIAFDLAQKDFLFAERLIENLNERRVDPTRADIESHFKYSIEDPLTVSLAIRQRAQNHSTSTMRSPVVVLDALDECGTDPSQSTQRQIFMGTIIKWSRLHPSFKLVITSRDQHISRSFREVCCHIPLETGNLVSHETTADIQTFFESRFADITSPYSSLQSWPGTSIIQKLTDRAAGMFIWAETVIGFLKQGPPKGQLDLILGGAFRKEGDVIDQLYEQILRHSFQNPEALDTFKRVVGAIVLAKTPLHRDGLKYFLGKQEDESSIDFILINLSSVISTRNTDGRIQINHLSFTEFLCNPKRGKEFAIDHTTHSQMMTLACLQIMKEDLRFNICELETSHVRNDDLNLTDRLKKAIPSHLSYACTFWAEHIQSTTVEVDILSEVREFMEIRLLYWLEVLSLIKQVTTAIRALILIGEWSKTHDEGIFRFAADARKFVSAFVSVISQSVPHIYLSALPFAPEQSLISKQYLPQFPQTISILVGKAAGWPAILHVLTGHTNVVTSVSFSQDGKRVVSGSYDHTIHIWDAETGDMVSGPFRGHRHWVTSVAFSQDGKRVVSGSSDKTIRIWDVEIGDMVSGPFRGHDHWVMSVSFSQDGKRVVSGSYDHTIRVWDAGTGDIVSGPFRGHDHWVTSVSFSQDGKRVVSGSYDDTIRIWDVETGGMVSDPFRGHDASVRSVSFSQDGKRVVSGSNDKTIRIWDVETGDVVSGPFRGHDDVVMSISFAQDGKRVVSGSSDKTIRIWDVETGDMVSGPFRGHDDWVNSVSFSQDGKRVVSGSNDKAICIWDVETGGMASDPFRGHDDWVRSVSFSHDGKRIVSGSHDKTICIWDVETGDMVSGPFRGHDYAVTSVSFSQDGKRVVSGSNDKTVRIWDVETGATVSGPFRGHDDWVTSVSFSQDGKRVVSGSDDKTIRIWDVETGDMVSGPFRGHNHSVRAVSFSHDGKRVVSGSEDKTIRIWDVETGDIVAGPFRGHNDWVNSVSFSQDGKRVVSGSNDKTLRIWDVETGDIVSDPFRDHADSVTSVSFSQDGKRVVSGSHDKTIRIWDVETGTTVSGPFRGHDDWVSSVSFSQDGKRVVSGSDNRTIRIWDVEMGDTVADPSRGHDQGVKSPVAFRDNSNMQDGWILGSHSELLFWVPPMHRKALWRPSNVCVIGPNPTKLDLDHFVHGSAWQSCRQ